MTRKDFQALADAIAIALAYCETTNQRRGVERAANEIASACQRSNPRFDRQRFLTAAGVA